MIWRATEWTTSEVATAVSGCLHGPDLSVRGVSTDSRESHPGALFVALRGPRFDGHEHLRMAKENGACAALVCPERVSSPPDLSFVHVQDTLTALGALGRAARRRGSAKVVGLTGSNGKTSTKELLAALLAPYGPVLKTEGNLNNAVGVPLTLLGLRPEDRFAVVEMGMNAEGEIRNLARIAEPDVAVVLNVGPAHIGELGSLEAIARAKGEMFEAAPESAVRVANVDDARVMAQLGGRGPAIRFGRAPQADVRLQTREELGDGRGQDVWFKIGDMEHRVFLPWSGVHHAMNLCAAVASVHALGLRMPDEMRLSLPAVQGRGVIRRVGAWSVVDDTYNANRASTLASLEAMAEQAQGRPMALLLGFMAELGEHSEREHEEVGRRAAQLGVNWLAAFGAGAEPAVGAAREEGVDARFEPFDEASLWSWIESRLDDQPWWILVKGSRASRMERFVKRLGAG
ncbi:MAG: UDP-N-acetylmuramoyl-tripeptide--D-alanyl-D-alanine ligase [Myxococcota bacterium]